MEYKKQNTLTKKKDNIFYIKKLNKIKTVAISWARN